MNDLGWMVFDMTVMATLFQFVAFGVIWLQRSDRATPLMPRWMSYFSFWCAASFVSVYLMPSFHTGPFSWQGLITLYVALVIFVRLGRFIMLFPLAGAYLAIWFARRYDPWLDYSRYCGDLSYGLYIYGWPAEEEED